jgi:hypothetical protein
MANVALPSVSTTSSAPPLQSSTIGRCPARGPTSTTSSSPPAGVWIIDAKNYDGRVERRDLGGWRHVDQRLFVNARDRTNLTARLETQAAAVAAVLTARGELDVPVHRVLCFTNSDWKLFAKPFTINGALITWAASLLDTMRSAGELDNARIDPVSRALADGLPPARH